MSLTNDAVTVFKNTLMSVIHKPEQRALPAPLEPVMVEQTTSPTTVPSLLDQSLLAVARDAADIRRDHDAILTKTATFSTLQEDLHGAFERAYQALEQLAEARSQLAKAEAVARFEHEARENAAQRLAGMTATYHQTVSELEKLRPEAKRLETSLRQTGDRLLQVGNRERDADRTGQRVRRPRSSAETPAKRRCGASMKQLKAELASTNGFVAQRVSEISQLHERCEIAEQGARTSARALEESRSECASALVRLDEERVKLASAESRVTALESQLKDLGDKFSSARASWSQEAEGFNETVSPAQGRSRAGDRSRRGP